MRDDAVVCMDESENRAGCEEGGGGGGLEKTQKRAVGDTSRGGGQLKTFVTVGVRTIGSAVERLNIADW